MHSQQRPQPDGRGEDEAAIRNAYRTKLTALYEKLKG